MEMLVDPVQEWKQIFMDAWRMERDYFYDPAMHGVNWNQVKDRYLKMMEGAITREDVNLVLGEMIAELNASHTYRGGGDEELARNKNVGYLGVNWQAEGEYYKIKKIIKAAAWDAEVRSPLDMPGVDVKEGNYVLAVNGLPLSSKEEPFTYFQGLGGKAVELTYNTTPSWTGAKTLVVECMTSEVRLRHLAWIESNRKRVDDATNGDVGYIYVRSTGVDGQNELIRQFSAQWDKKALIIDERFNNGGQIPDRFIEMLNREPLAFWAIRDGNTWPWPPYAHFGPKVMLINGWSGSGGDAFPDYFKKKKLGPLIGARTWGGLIGISGVPGLIDGGSITVPTFRMYNPDGTWFKEGHGVDPDIEVLEDLTSLSKGIDTQLERAISEIKNLMQKNGFTRPARPAAEVR
jgi:tricorn protease